MKVGDERVVRADGREFSATVRALLPARNRETRTVDVVLTLSTKENALRHGDLVELEALPRAIEKSGFWLPRSALTESSRGLWAVLRCHTPRIQRVFALRGFRLRFASARLDEAQRAKSVGEAKP